MGALLNLAVNGLKEINGHGGNGFDHRVGHFRPLRIMGAA